MLIALEACSRYKMNKAEVLYNKAQANLKDKSYNVVGEAKAQDALKYLNKAIKLNPYSEKYYDARGCSYYHQGKYESAISDFNLALELNPEFNPSYNNRGMVYYSLGQFEKSESDYLKAIELNKEDYNVCYNLGLLYNDWKKFSQALSAYNLSIIINPAYNASYLNRELTKTMLGMYEEAVSDFDTV